VVEVAVVVLLTLAVLLLCEVVYTAAVALVVAQMEAVFQQVMQVLKV
jgi:hypothetical protein